MVPFADGSSQHYIPNIRTPTLWLVSRDDPFVAMVPVELCLANPNIALAETSRGGHVAFLEGAHTSSHGLAAFKA
jgi:abhydrolase domain-containing protein 1/3